MEFTFSLGVSLPLNISEDLLTQTRREGGGEGGTQPTKKQNILNYISMCTTYCLKQSIMKEFKSSKDNNSI